MDFWQRPEYQIAWIVIHLLFVDLLFNVPLENISLLYVETSKLPLKGRKNGRSLLGTYLIIPWNKWRALSWHSCCDMRLSFFAVLSEVQPQFRHLGFLHKTFRTCKLWCLWIFFIRWCVKLRRPSSITSSSHYSSVLCHLASTFSQR